MTTSALDRLKADPKWVAWKYKQRGKGGKPTKPPINPHTGKVASVADPATWGTHAQALARVETDNLEGVGYVLTADDGLTGADLDHVRNAETGEIVDWAGAIVALAETYCEVSPSGTGLRFFWKGKLEHAVKNDKQQTEVYSEGRYLTITGNIIAGCPDEIREAPLTLAALLARAATVDPDEDKKASKANGKGDGGDEEDIVKVPNPDDEWRKLNTAALQNLTSWVPDLFPGKAKPGPRGGYRVPSRDLGRDLQEDIGITVEGIVDFGVADQGDSRKGKRTPIGLVMEHRSCSFDEAVGWLCKQLGVRRPGVVLDPQDPLRSAYALMTARYLTEDELPILHRHNGTFWAWKDNCYKNVEDETLRTSIWKFLEHVRKITDKGIKPYKPKRENVSNILDALNAVAALDPFITVPSWLKERDMPPAREFLACANGLLHVPSGHVYPPTPDFFGVAATTVAYDETATVPQAWLEFLDQVIEDADGIATLQEWFGYTLTPDTSQQKILLCYGQPRSGKGTVARIHTAMLGADSVAGPTMSSLAENFGLEQLITRPVAIVSDARIGGKSDKAVIVERLLSISGEDSLSVPRKFLQSWNGRLPTRFEIMTNELPSLSEGSGALARRLIILLFPNTFYGREDHGLEGKLKRELPGVLNWAIEGYRRLRERGRFVQPASGQYELEQIEMLGSPVKAFLRDRCEVGSGFEVAVDELYDRWKSWRSAEGARDIGTKEWFGRNLHSAVPGLTVARRGSSARTQLRTYCGIRLATSEGPAVDDGAPPF